MTSERDSARLEFETMRKQRLDEFMSGFSVITNKLKEMYQVKILWMWFLANQLPGNYATIFLAAAQ